MKEWLYGMTLAVGFGASFGVISFAMFERAKQGVINDCQELNAFYIEGVRYRCVLEKR